MAEKTTEAGSRLRVFISHADTDTDLARRVTDVLEESGFQTWLDSQQILPGDNWGEKIAEALRESNAMVVLLTPDSLRSLNVDNAISYALGNQNYKDRLIPVVAAPPEQLPREEIPWVFGLERFQTIHLPDKGQDEEGLKRIAQALRERA